MADEKPVERLVAESVIDAVMEVAAIAQIAAFSIAAKIVRGEVESWYLDRASECHA